MVKRQVQLSSFKLTRGKTKYTVLLKPLKNTPNGNPRYGAIILNKDGYNWAYAFDGHYYGEQQEAEFILDYMLNEDKK